MVQRSTAFLYSYHRRARVRLLPRLRHPWRAALRRRCQRRAVVYRGRSPGGGRRLQCAGVHGRGARRGLRDHELDRERDCPERIIATEFMDDEPEKSAAVERPLCSYPTEAKYVSGDPNVTTSFDCADI
ncbi:uncharacterized protein B0H18DRAFT_43220 [Fomitopsis serialis]|uniref:uncharacterized protein n=1 Tax=Fomitopsis serialis TaxID=139415 RepID=UPI00200730F9|nr:uncharacterized protein B0H18DRAFT_43220 [Neoantrodia serialis]KAH9917175.1 hypothetical protein B0H18DRAFT_43220 [Neoantrodia serialis]